jgi:hypothetical protein
MKRCPKCNADYFDNMLEFCLEDGTRLTSLSDTSGGAKTTQANPPRPTAAETVSLPFAGVPKTLEVPGSSSGEIETIVAKTDMVLPAMQAKTSSILENAPIVFALAHNWWQWLYLEKQYMSSIMDYVLSANFLMWLLLLAAGIIVSLLAVKRSERKIVAYTSLVILAINLILFLVPRR